MHDAEAKLVSNNNEGKEIAKHGRKEQLYTL